MNLPKVKYKPIKTKGIPHSAKKPGESWLITDNSQNIAKPHHRIEKGINIISWFEKTNPCFGLPLHNLTSPNSSSINPPFSDIILYLCKK